MYTRPAAHLSDTTSITARASRLSRTFLALIPAVTVAAVACSSNPPTPHEQAVVAHPASALGLGSQSFAVLAGTTITNIGPSVVSGDLGVSPGSAITGFPPGLVIGGTIHAGDAVALQAQGEVGAAYDELAGQACDENLTGQDLGGMTLTPGTYCFSSSAQLTGSLTLDAQGDPDAAFVFQIGSTLITASNASVQIINGGSYCNVYWQVSSSATIGTGTTIMGSIIALTNITLSSGSSVFGRALARNAAVTMDSNSVSAANCRAALDAGSMGNDASTGNDAAVAANDAGTAIEDAGDSGQVQDDASVIALDSGATEDAATDAAIQTDAGQDAAIGTDAGLSVCATGCFDLQTDDDHCGSCNHACAGSESCIDGVCCAL